MSVRTYSPEIEVWRKRGLPVGASFVVTYPGEPVVLVTRERENTWAVKLVEFPA